MTTSLCACSQEVITLEPEVEHSFAQNILLSNVENTQEIQQPLINAPKVEEPSPN